MALAPILVMAAALALASLLGCHAGDPKTLHPVVVVPGYGSNRLDARLTAAYVPSAPACAAGAAGAGDDGWFQLWPNHTGTQDASRVPCFADQMSLVYDAGADDYRNAAGVATRVPFFGSTRGLVGWDRLVRQLQDLGYRDGASLFAAPYDFRYTVAPRGHPSAVGDRYFSDLRRLVRRARRLNGGRPAIVVAHSFGCALTYQFLLSRPLRWRRRHVRHVVLLAPALGGFAEGMHGLATGAGFGYGLPGVTPPTMTRLARSQQSTLWRLPTPEVFGDRPLVVTKNATYTARNVTGFLEAIGFGEGVRPYVTRVLPLWEALPAPMVPVTSVIGYGVRTPESYVFGEEGFEAEPEVVYGDGDGAINMVSLAATEEWSGVEGQVLKVVRLPGLHHDGFFSVDFAIETVLAEMYEAAAGTIELHSDI
ncbi:hypothetical protein ACP4OV_015443 [Aristida adscensionis]